MVEIIPAVLPKSLQELSASLERLRGVSRKVQVDAYEGGWWGVGRTWPFRDQGSFERMLAEKTGLPFWTEFDFEFDLMMKHPKELALTLVDLHAARIVLHAGFPGALEAAQWLDQHEDGDHPTPVEVGIALGAHAAPEDLFAFDGLYDFVQVMGIDRVGRQGEPPDPHGKAVELVRTLRRHYPDMSLQVDGAAAARARAYAEAGANRLIIGSAIVKADNPKEAYERLYTKANG